MKDYQNIDAERYQRIAAAVVETGGYRTFDGVDMHIGYESVQAQAGKAATPWFISENPPAGYFTKDGAYIEYTEKERAYLHENLVEKNNSLERNAIIAVENAAYRLELSQAEQIRMAGCCCSETLDSCQQRNSTVRTNYMLRSKRKPLLLVALWVMAITSVLINLLLWNTHIDTLGTATLIFIISFPASLFMWSISSNF